MSIRIKTEPTVLTQLTFERDDNTDDRVKITLKNGEELFFRGEVARYGGSQLVLDTVETDDNLVRQILLPQEREPECFCGHDDCDDETHRSPAREFNVFDVITPEQYLQLTYAYLEFRDYSHSPQVGQPLFLWRSDRLRGGGSGGELDQDNVITNIEVVTLGS